MTAWDARTGKNVNKFRIPLKGQKYVVQSVAYFPDGLRIVSASFGPSIHILDAHSGRLVPEMSETLWQNVRSLACSPDGAYIVSSTNATIHLWDVSRGRLAQPSRKDTGAADAVAYSPDGQYIASGSVKNTLYIWYMHTG